ARRPSSGRREAGAKRRADGADRIVQERRTVVHKQRLWLPRSLSPGTRCSDCRLRVACSWGEGAAQDPGGPSMKFHALLAVMAGLLPGGDAPPGDRAAEMEALRGEWRLVATQDQKHTDCGSADIRMIVREDGHVVFRFREVQTNEGTLRV